MALYICDNCLGRSSMLGHWDKPFANDRKLTCERLEGLERTEREQKWKRFFEDYPEEGTWMG